jgi:hypothetical protein
MCDVMYTVCPINIMLDTKEVAAYPGIISMGGRGGVQQIQLRTEGEENWNWGW